MSDTLHKSLAVQILSLHKEIIAEANRSLDKAIRIGKMLTGIKGKTPHGEWLPWLEENVAAVSEKTAQNYMRCYENREAIKAHKVTDVTEAYKLCVVSTKKASRRATKSETVADLTEQATQAQSSTTSMPSPKPAMARATVDAVEVVRDINGTELPPGVLKYWNRRDEMKEMAVAISRVKCAIENGHKKDDRMFAEIKQDIVSKLDTAYHDITLYAIYALCPDCQGHPESQPNGNCRLCFGRGVVSKFRWDRVPEEKRKLIEKMGRKK